jgi:hypothetical protein
MPTLTETSYESGNAFMLENVVVQLVGAVAGLAHVVDRVVEAHADELGKHEHEQLVRTLVKVKHDLDRVLDQFEDE